MSGTIDLEAARGLLCERLLSYLEDLSPELRTDVLDVLSVEGKLFHQPASLLDGRWALLPFYLACDLRPDVDPVCASAVALAMECLVCATDLFDDAMDDDLTPLLQRLGMARALNTALALVYLVQRILLSLSTLKSPVPLLNVVQRAMLAASAGQQKDLLAERRVAYDLSRNECIEIAAAKAGTLLALACELGAICAEVDESLRVRCIEMGRLLGIAAQLDNDAHDLSHQLQPSSQFQLSYSPKSDLERAKKTLPVVLAAHSIRATRSLDTKNIDSALQHLTILTGEERKTCVHALREGILATWGIALLYRERARECLMAIERGRVVSPGLRVILGLAEALEE